MSATQVFSQNGDTASYLEESKGDIYEGAFKVVKIKDLGNVFLIYITPVVDYSQKGKPILHGDYWYSVVSFKKKNFKKGKKIRRNDVFKLKLNSYHYYFLSYIGLDAETFTFIDRIDRMDSVKVPIKYGGIQFMYSPNIIDLYYDSIGEWHW